MASIIDNRSKTMLDSLKNSLKQAESVDILTAFFYFSGFNALAEDLKDKKIRILVGCTIDPNAIGELCNAVKNNPDEELSSYSIRGYNNLNNSQKKNNYINSFIDLFNKSSLADEFDSTENQAIFKMFLNKIKDGTLEIRLTARQDHSKFYVITNKYEYSCFGDQKGVVFMGSSNFTYNGLLGQGEMNEGFCWNDINTTYLKCRIKGKSVNDVKSMSLYGMIETVPEFYMVALINSSFVSYYVDSFINNTQTFQINDARQIPIIIPSEKQLLEISTIFNEAVKLKKKEFKTFILQIEELNSLQCELDKIVASIYKINREN